MITIYNALRAHLETDMTSTWSLRKVYKPGVIIESLGVNEGFIERNGGFEDQRGQGSGMGSSASDMVKFPFKLAGKFPRGQGINVDDEAIVKASLMRKTILENSHYADVASLQFVTRFANPEEVVTDQTFYTVTLEVEFYCMCLRNEG